MITELRLKELFIASSLHFESETYHIKRYNGRIKHQPKIAPNSTEWARFKKLANKLVTEDAAIQFFMINQINHYLEQSKFSKYIGDFYTQDAFRNVLRFENIEQNYAYHIFKSLSNDDGLLLKDLINIDKSEQPVPIIIQSMMKGDIDFAIVSSLMVTIPKLSAYWVDNSDDDFFFKPLVGAVQRFSILMDIDPNQKKSITTTIQQLNQKHITD